MKLASPEALADLLRERLAAEEVPPGDITLSDLLDRHLPYAGVRTALDLAGKAEYDLAVLRLLVCEELVTVDPRLRKAVEAQLAAPEPGLRFPDALKGARVRLRAPGPGASAAGAPAGVEPSGGAVEPFVPEPPPRALAEVAAGPPPEPVAEADLPSEAPAARCRRCDAALPARDGTRFCPRCGVEQIDPRCSACGGRVEAEWRFCPRCGRALD